MKSTLIKLGAILALGAVLGLNTARANVIDYSSTEGSVIQFNGDGTFEFIPDLSSFEVTNDYLPGAPAQGLFGEIVGLFTIGDIQTVSTPFGDISNAPVTGSGTFSILDEDLVLFSANVEWVNITQFGGSSALNAQGYANLTGVVYEGDNTTLLVLKNAIGVGSTLNFTFNPAVSLTNLKTSEDVRTTSFSGSVSVPEGGETLMLLGFGLSCLAFMRRRLAA